MIQLCFLGTGTSQGVPMLLSDEPVNFSDDPKDQRMRSSVWLSWENFDLLIDCGADFRMQMLQNKVKNLDAILFTHEHSDHVAGLDDIRPYCYKNGAMPIYGLPRVMDALKRRYEYIFATENRYAGAASVTVNPIEPFQTFELGGKTIIPIYVQHGSLPILGYRIEKIAYLTDVKFLSDEALEQLKDLEVLVISALRIQKHPTHLNLEEALAYVEEIQPKKAYFTHISHRLGFHKEVEQQLPENVFLSYDGLKID